MESICDTCSMLAQQTEILQAQYVLMLFVLGSVGAVFVCFLLYKFIKLFY